MADIAYLAFQRSGSEAVGVKWNNILPDLTLRNLSDETASALGWTGQYLTGPAGGLDGNTDNVAGSGDASWVDEAIVTYSGHYQGNTWITYRVDVGVANVGEDFNVVLFPSHPAARGINMRVNGGEIQSHSGITNNTTTVYTFPVQPDASGYINIEYQSFPAGGSAYLRAAYVEKVAPAADTTPPTVSSASVPTAGNTIAVQMDEAMQVGAGGSGGWTISLGDATISAAAVDGVDDTVVNLTPSRTLTSSDSFTIGYTQPTDGFQDQAATPNDLATFSGQAVTNNSTQVAQVPGISAQTIRDKAGDLTPNATNLKIAVRESSDPESTVHFSTTTGSLNGSSQTAAINLGSAGVNVGDTVHFSYFNPALNEGLNVDLTVEDIA